MTVIRMMLVGVLFVGAIAMQAHEGNLSFSLKPLGKSVWAAIDAGTVTAPAASNAGVIVGDDGVVVVDTFASAAAAAQLLAEIRKLTQLPVKFVINTHYHLDHVAGNKVFADTGALVLAHHHVRWWIHPENLKFFGNDVKPEHKAMVEAIMPPVAGYDHSVDVHLGTRTIRVQSFPGHTGGDSVVFVPDANVAFLGDLFWRQIAPNMIDASSAAWVATLETLAKNADYAFVPGHGETGTARDVAAFRDYIATLRQLVADAQARGQGGEALSATVLKALSAKYGQWDAFKFLGPINIREMEAELNGKKRIPQARPPQ